MAAKAIPPTATGPTTVESNAKTYLGTTDLLE